MPLGLPRKLCICATPHCSSLVITSLVVLQDVSENAVCWKSQGLSGDSAVLREFLHLYQQGFFSTPSCSAPFNRYTGLGNRKRKRKSRILDKRTFKWVWKPASSICLLYWIKPGFFLLASVFLWELRSFSDAVRVCVYSSAVPRKHLKSVGDFSEIWQRYVTPEALDSYKLHENRESRKWQNVAIKRKTIVWAQPLLSIREAMN